MFIFSNCKISLQSMDQTFIWLSKSYFSRLKTISVFSLNKHSILLRKLNTYLLILHFNTFSRNCSYFSLKPMPILIEKIYKSNLYSSQSSLLKTMFFSISMKNKKSANKSPKILSLPIFSCSNSKNSKIIKKQNSF